MWVGDESTVAQVSESCSVVRCMTIANSSGLIEKPLADAVINPSGSKLMR
jgi:hypothetical protein